MTMTSDEIFMARAIELASRGREHTAPNPCVGAVMVSDGQIVAEGWHHFCGGLHAERECIADARKKGVDMTACTMYVTLEPCNHYGKTPPCTQGIIEAGIRHIVVGARDPNAVAAGGVEFLKEKGITVQTGILERECLDLISDFIVWQKTARPYSIVKMASTLDGRIAGPEGKPEAVSSPESFAQVQNLRAIVGAIIVGGNTLYQDNPGLTCRKPNLPEDFIQPRPVVVTSRLPKADSELTAISSRFKETIFWTDEETACSNVAKRLRAKGIEVTGLPYSENGLNLKLGLEKLRKDHGILRTLCEGGGKLAMSLVSAGLCDELVWFQAPRILGNENGVPVFSGGKAGSMAETVNFRMCSFEKSGPDLKIIFKPEDS